MTMNMSDMLEIAIFAPALVGVVCFLIIWAWGAVFLIKAVRAANRMGSLRKCRARCPDLGMRLTSRVTPATVKLLLFMHAYVHPDKRVRAFGEFALRFLHYQPEFVFAAAIAFEVMFVLVALLCLLVALAAFKAGSNNWLLETMCLVPLIVTVPVVWYTFRAYRRRKRLLSRLLVFSGKLQKRMS